VGDDRPLNRGRFRATPGDAFVRLIVPLPRTTRLLDGRTARRARRAHGEIPAMTRPVPRAHARSRLPSGAGLPAALLALCLLVPAAHADADSAARAWKIAHAQRMAEEGMERRGVDPPRERAALARRQGREPRERSKQAHATGGTRSRPAPPSDLPARRQPPAAAHGSLTLGDRVVATPPNHIVNNRAFDGAQSAQSENGFAALGDLMLAAWNDGQGIAAQQGWASSTDGGQTWFDQGSLPTNAPGVTNFQWVSDPVLTVNEKTGAFYFSALCDFRVAGSDSTGVGVVKGRWNGPTFTWGAPAITRVLPATPTPEPDKEWIVADSSSGRVYLSYTRFPVTGSVIDFQWADSNATSWSAARQISLNTISERGFVQGSRPVVDGDGRLLVMYELIGSGFSDFYRVARSLDHGVTFSAPVTAESLYTNFGTGPPGFNRPNAVDFAGISADRSHGPNRGRFYLSWAESINWLDEVFTLGQAGSKSEVEGNGTPNTATPVTAGQTIRGTISDPNDLDYYAIPLAQGDNLVVAADSVEAGPAGAMSLRLLAANGSTSLTFDLIDSGVNATGAQPEGFPAGWLFTAPRSDTYFIRVTSNSGLGTYRLRTGLAHRGAERGRDQRDVFVGASDDGLTWSTPVRVNEDPVGFDNFLPEVAVAPDGGVYCAWYDYHDSAPSTDGGEAAVYLARSGDGGATWTTLGAMTDTLTNWTNVQSNLMPNQGDYMALAATDSRVITTWSDGRRGDPDVFSAQIPIIPNGAQVVFRSVQLAARTIDLAWKVTPADTMTLRLYRATDDSAFVFEDLVQSDAAGALAYTDTTVTGGHVYTYRLGHFTNGVELFQGQVRVFLPGSFRLAIQPARPNPVTGTSFIAGYSLFQNGPADLILFDVTGREVFRRTVTGGLGPHAVILPVDPGLHQGMYVLTLRQGGHNASTRIFLVR